MRPRITAWPVVGVVIWVKSLSSVDLPAPLRPMIPSTSPWFTEKDVLDRPDLLVVLLVLAAEEAAPGVRERVRNVPYPLWSWPIR